MDNYIVINGKKAELTAEQLEKLGIKVKVDCFDRADNCDVYYYIDSINKVMVSTEVYFDIDSKRFNCGNYCTDKSVMHQRALHEKLNRLLWRFSCQNGELDNPWDCSHSHYIIYYNYEKKTFLADWAVNHCKYAGEIYFTSREVAQKAIKEIIEPFMRENPDFVW